MSELTNRQLQEPTLNQKIETAWAQFRTGQIGLVGKDRRTYKNRIIHVIADALGADFDRVRTTHRQVRTTHRQVRTTDAEGVRRWARLRPT